MSFWGNLTLFCSFLAIDDGNHRKSCKLYNHKPLTDTNKKEKFREQWTQKKGSNIKERAAGVCATVWGLVWSVQQFGLLN
jgi:hypothetical protein